MHDKDADQSAQEAAVIWQDVFDEIMAGRAGNILCPACGHRPMTVELLSGELYQGGIPHGPTRISCSKCGKYVEGTFGAY
ncbi:MAG: hypothetical protein AAGC55_12900 [Myxococcota bacterium]